MFQQNTGTYYRQIKVAKKAFTTLPIIAFRKDISLKQIIGTNTIRNNEKLVKTKNNHHAGKCVQFNMLPLLSTTYFNNNIQK